MIYLKTDEEIELLRDSNLLVSKTLGELSKYIRAGISTNYLDKIAETYIRDNGGLPSFLGYYGFPKSICTSVNSQVAHSIPSDYILKDGDILSVDCGVKLNGFHGDSCFTFCVSGVSENKKKLVDVTRRSLDVAISFAKCGNRIGDIGNAVVSFCDSFGFSVVKNIMGHGIGRSLHEEPYVPNYGKPKSGIMLKEGMVLSIEPIISEGNGSIHLEEDGWTISTKDNSNSAHFEKTVVVRKGKIEELSSFDYIDKVL